MENTTNRRKALAAATVGAAALMASTTARAQGRADKEGPVKVVYHVTQGYAQGSRCVDSGDRGDPVHKNTHRAPRLDRQIAQSSPSADVSVEREKHPSAHRDHPASPRMAKEKASDENSRTARLQPPVR